MIRPASPGRVNVVARSTRSRRSSGVRTPTTRRITHASRGVSAVFVPRTSHRSGAVRSRSRLESRWRVRTRLKTRTRIPALPSHAVGKPARKAEILEMEDGLKWCAAHPAFAWRRRRLLPRAAGRPTLALTCPSRSSSLLSPLRQHLLHSGARQALSTGARAAFRITIARPAHPRRPRRVRRAVVPPLVAPPSPVGLQHGEPRLRHDRRVFLVLF